MPVQDLNDPHIVNFFNECYNKTSRIRVKWNTDNAEKLQKTACYTKEPKLNRDVDIIQKTLSIELLSTARDHISSSCNRRVKPKTDGELFRLSDMKKDHTITDVVNGDPLSDSRKARPDTVFTLDPIMKPVDAAVREILYKGKPIYGKKVYLKTRSYEPKDNQYYFPEVSQWEYGWKQKESYFRPHVPKHPRVYSLTKAMVSTGPQVDPPYYQEIQADGPVKCPLMKS